jgi:hypothetical protein
VGGHRHQDGQVEAAGEGLDLGEVGERGGGRALVGKERPPVEQRPGDAVLVAVPAQPRQRGPVAGERPVELAHALVDEPGQEVDTAPGGGGCHLVRPGDLAVGGLGAAEAEQRYRQAGPGQGLGLGVAGPGRQPGGAAQVGGRRRGLAQLVQGEAQHPLGHGSDGGGLVGVAQQLGGPGADRGGVAVPVLGEGAQLEGRRIGRHGARS